MPRFSGRSIRLLETCDDRLCYVMKEAIRYQDFMVVCGFRGQEAQDEAFLKGRSDKEWPEGKHNVSPSLAVDIAPWPVDWLDTHRFALLAGRILQIGDINDIEIRWGSDWDGDSTTLDHQLKDWGHFELIT